jgi:hypothetical protein
MRTYAQVAMRAKAAEALLKSVDILRVTSLVAEKEKEKEKEEETENEAGGDAAADEHADSE